MGSKHRDDCQNEETATGKPCSLNGLHLSPSVSRASMMSGGQKHEDRLNVTYCRSVAQDLFGWS